MKPKTISPSSLQVAEKCLKRFEVEYVGKSRTVAGTPALLGTACHAALEMYTRRCVFGKNEDERTLETLIKYYEEAFKDGFGGPDEDKEAFEDGIEMLTRWHKSNEDASLGDERLFDTVEVITTETKQTFPVPVSLGTIPMNFIVDRADMHPDLGYRVVDYKGLALDTPIPTPVGFVEMGDLLEGDEVIGGDGKPCIVKHKSQVKHRNCFKVTFSDGTHIICDDEHRWEVNAGRRGRIKSTVMTASEMFRWEKRRADGEVQKLSIDNVGMELSDADLPIDPYTLGVWLGDGHRWSGTITNPDNRLRDALERRGNELTTRRDYDSMSYSIVGLTTALKDAGLWINKHIPEEYLFASRGQRLELLYGLMDTDGCWHKTRRRVVVTTTSQAYALDLKRLVDSLGWPGTVFEVKTTGFGKKWDAYHLCFTPVEGFAFDARRSGEMEPRNNGKSTRRYIESIESIESVPTACIEVDSPEHTFLAGEQFIKTHNTVRYPLSAEEMQKKLQFRIYALAAEMKYPGQDMYWVFADNLRDEAPTGVAFTHDENVATWEYIIHLAETIVATEAPAPTLNSECGWCILNATCPAVQKSIDIGNIDTLETEEQVDVLGKLQAQSKAVETALKRVKGILEEKAEHEDVNLLLGEKSKALLTRRNTRVVTDADEIRNIVGEDLFDEYGSNGASITITALDQMKKKGGLTDEQKNSIDALVKKERAAKPTITVKDV